MSAPEDTEGFLSRWSRRKREAARGDAPAAEPAPLPPPQPLPESLPEAAPEPPVDLPVQASEAPPEEAPRFAPESLPPVESLTAESDISAFLRPEVPSALRRAALRRIWTLDPAIRDFVGLADYAWDYNAPDGVPGFALDLGGDARKLLAHALGLGEPEAQPQEQQAPDAGIPTAEAAPADFPTEPEPVPPPVALASEAEAAPEAPPDTQRPPARRHGGATPA